MRLTTLITVLILVSVELNAQVVTTVPYFATENDSIVIVFDAAKGNQGLLNFNGSVYAHTGVITDLSTSPSDWKYVIGSWGNNSTQPQLSYAGNNKYRLVIGYPSSFYNVTNANEKILQLAFVFRSADNSKTGRDVGGADIFADLYEEGLNIAIVEPDVDFQFGELNEQINIVAISSASAELKLFIDENEVVTTNNDSINYSITLQNYGRTIIKAVAYDGIGNQKTDSAYYVVRGEIVVEDLPPGIIDGINYIDGTTVTLSLYAPNKNFVYVIGDFNNWLVEPVYEMKVTPNRSNYWITITNLIPGEEYGFQYYVDGELVIPDPYADKILDPWNDGSIPASTYPNLKNYPVGKTTNVVSVLQTAQEEYHWKVTDFEKPAKQDLIIYELLIRDFVSTHDYRVLIDTLSYFEKLGVNAIELMPVSEFEGNESWGYNPMMYFAVDKYYGTKNDLKTFIDAAHEKGIAVIMDIVLNHAYGLNPMVQLYFDDAKGQPSPDNPWFNQVSPNPVFSWGYDFNHESSATKNFVDRVNKYWLTEYKFDGFRFDFTKGFTNKSGDGSSYDASRIQILKRMADKIWEADPDAYVILEHFAPSTEERELTDYGMMVWGNMNYNYSEAAMGYHDAGKSNFSGISYKSKNFTNPHLVGYMESHDEERLMFKNLQYGNSYDWYSVKNLSTALNRIKMAAVFFLTVPGPKMLWQFEELGYDVSIDYNGRVGNKPILWNYYQDEERLLLFKTIAAIIDMRKSNEVFRTSDFGIYAFPAIKRIQLNHETMNATILGNFNVIAGDISPNFQQKGYWYDFFSGDSILVEDTLAAISLAPGEFHIYTDWKLAVPEEGILTDINQTVSVGPQDFQLYQNYPNPFNPTTMILYRVVDAFNASTTMVTLKLYDVLGREIKTLVNKLHVPGNFEIQFDGSGLASGVYFYTLQIGSQKVTKKMLLLR